MKPEELAIDAAGAMRIVKRRTRQTSLRHWLGSGEPSDHRAVVDEIRRQYQVTAREYYNSAMFIYDSLDIKAHALLNRAPLTLTNKNVQLFIAYSILWEAFDHIYTAASYTAFARGDKELDYLEEDRTKIGRVLVSPFITEEEYSSITHLRSGETSNFALNRMLNRSSRELKIIYGVGYDRTLTDMASFLQGVVEFKQVSSGTGELKTQTTRETWVVEAVDSRGEKIDAEGEFNSEKYRSVITWHCFQIRKNLNFVGKSDGSIDDAILIMRAFCLLEPIVRILLVDSKKGHIFAL